MTHRGNSPLQKAKARLLEGISVPENEVFVVDDFQREAVEAVVGGEDTLVVAPTGAGKTYIAMQAIEATLQLRTKAVYTTPLKALSNTKFLDLKRTFEPMYKVGLLTGDRKIDVDADVVVATTEIYRNELYRDYGRYSLVVLDEVHFLADLQRGPVWEESIILTPKDSTLLMLSASISNASEIAAWLEDVRGKKCRVVIKKERPVELRLGFLHPELGILPLSDERGHLTREVAQFYGSVQLDQSGMRLKGGQFARRQNNNRPGNRSRSRRGQRRP